MARAASSRQRGNVLTTYDFRSRHPIKISEQMIYGSSRIGMNDKFSQLISWTPPPTGRASRTMGLKSYELTDHLGNVLTTISDRKKRLAGATPAFEAVIETAQDYYPFGSLMPGRKYNAGEYRFGFNGQEKDDEIAGVTGSHVSFKYRVHDTRLGRFLSNDPLSKDYPMLTPYQFASNTPIQAIELEGLEGLIIIDIVNLPSNFNKKLYVDELKRKLLDNGAHPKTKVVLDEDYSLFEEISDKLSGTYKKNQSFSGVIRNFDIRYDKYKKSDKGGEASINSGYGTMYTGLNQRGENGMKYLPSTEDYINVTLHELGHATYGFEHDANGDTKSGEGYMDYDHAYEEDAKFDESQQREIYQRALGVDAISTPSNNSNLKKNEEDKGE
jgi:RHS repeat-associated protein